MPNTEIAVKNSVAKAIVRLNKFNPKFDPEKKIKGADDTLKFSTGELKALTSSWFAPVGKKSKTPSRRAYNSEQVANVISKKTVFKFDKAIWDQGIKDGVIGKKKTYSNPDIATYMLLASGIKADELKKGTKGKLWDSTLLFNAIDQKKPKLKKWVDETAEAMKPKAPATTKA